jgi:hypothetical protein
MRFIGVMNAAVWFGGTLFFTVAISPFFSGSELVRILSETYSTLAGHLLADRYYALQYWCGALAVAHLLAEWVYLGRALQRLTLWALIAAFLLGFVGGLVIHPRIKHYHQHRYGRAEAFTPAQKAQGTRSYGVWTKTAFGFQVVALGCIAIYTWRMLNPPVGPRFVPTNKFRG